MEQYTRIGFKITKEQKKILEAKAKSAGYNRLAIYLRSKLFSSISTEDKIDEIYKKIFRDSKSCVTEELFSKK